MKEGKEGAHRDEEKDFSRTTFSSGISSDFLHFSGRGFRR